MYYCDGISQKACSFLGWIPLLCFEGIKEWAVVLRFEKSYQVLMRIPSQNPSKPISYQNQFMFTFK